MRICEISDSIKTYLAQVRVNATVLGPMMNCRTSVQADNITSARYMLARIYGYNNILSLKEVIIEAGATNQLKTPQELQVKSLMDKSSELKHQAQKAKSLQKLQKAQLDYAKVNSTGNQ
jgi:hypothetical protein